MDEVISVLPGDDQSSSNTGVNAVDGELWLVAELEAGSVLHEFLNCWNDFFDNFLMILDIYLISFNIFDSFIKIDTSVRKHLSRLKHILIANLYQSDNSQFVKDGPYRTIGQGDFSFDPFISNVHLHYLESKERWKKNFFFCIVPCEFISLHLNMRNRLVLPAEENFEHTNVTLICFHVFPGINESIVLTFGGA